MEQTNDFKIENFSLGSDCELFIFDNEKQEVVNAKKYVKGSKHKPYNFDKSSPFWCTSLDNASAEFNIPPCTSAKEFSAALEKCIQYISSTLPENMCVIHTPAVYFNPNQLRTRESRMFGCESDFSAYTLRRNPRPEGTSTNLRTCCTHVHMKYDNMRFEQAAEWIKAMDLFLGIPGLLIEPENERRRLYGTLGSFRFGNTVEYRAMSSYFSQSDELRQWIFNNSVNAINWINEGNRVSEEMAHSFQQALTDKDLAQIIVEENNIPMLSK